MRITRRNFFSTCLFIFAPNLWSTYLEYPPPPVQIYMYSAAIYPVSKLGDNTEMTPALYYESKQMKPSVAGRKVYNQQRSFHTEFLTAVTKCCWPTIGLIRKGYFLLKILAVLIIIHHSYTTTHTHKYDLLLNRHYTSHSPIRICVLCWSLYRS